MALMRSTIAAATWMKHWPRSRCITAAIAKNTARAAGSQMRDAGYLGRETRMGFRLPSGGVPTRAAPNRVAFPIDVSG